MFIQKYPDIASKLGLIGTKASILRFGNADWLNYFSLINQTAAAIEMIGFGFVTSWSFGREYADRVLKDLLALPVSRIYIVISKLLVIAAWCTLLSVLMLLSGIAGGKLIGLTGWTTAVFSLNLGKYAGTSAMTLLLVTPVAFFASFGRGYLLPMAFVILTLILANFVGLVGLGPYFPWAIPGIYSIQGSLEGMQLNTMSYYIVFITFICALGGTIAYWRLADQK